MAVYMGLTINGYLVHDVSQLKRLTSLVNTLVLATSRYDNCIIKTVILKIILYKKEIKIGNFFVSY